jgi:thioesterase domain-containing protein
MAIIERIYRHAMIGYRPQVLPSRGMLFVSKDDWQSNAYRQLDDSLGTSRWFGGGLEVLDVPGDHVTVLDEPHLPELAQCYKKGLEKLRSKQFSS